MRWIIDVLIRQGVRDDLAVGSIDCQMEFAPFPARLLAVLRLQPLAGPVNLQSVLSINRCNGPCGTEAGLITANPTARRLIGV